MIIAHAARAHARKCVIPQRSGSAPVLIPTTWSRVKPHSIQARPILSWLFNPKEEPVAHKHLTPLKLDETRQRLLFWDSTYTTPNLKPEFNGMSMEQCLSKIVDSEGHTRFSYQHFSIQSYRKGSVVSKYRSKSHRRSSATSDIIFNNPFPSTLGLRPLDEDCS